MKKRLFAVLASLCMVVSMVPTMAFAQDSGAAIGASGLCEHHTEHTADCGYTEGTAEIPCGHQHDENCGGLTDPATCNHTHDESCGYVSATEGTPCTFVCEICNGQASGEPQEQCSCTVLCTEGAVNPDCPVCSADGADLSACQGEAPVEPVTCTCATLCTEGSVNGDCPVCSAEDADLSACKGAAAGIQVTSWQFDENPSGFAIIEEGGVFYAEASQGNLPLDTLVSMLPQSLTAQVEGQEESVSVPLTGWSCPEYLADAQGAWPTAGEYVFTASVPEEYAFANAPVVTVRIAGSVNLLAAGDYTVTTSGNTVTYTFHKFSGGFQVYSASIGEGQDLILDFTGVTDNQASSISFEIYPQAEGSTITMKGASGKSCPIDFIVQKYPAYPSVDIVLENFSTEEGNDLRLSTTGTSTITYSGSCELGTIWFEETSGEQNLTIQERDASSHLKLKLVSATGNGKERHLTLAEGTYEIGRGLSSPFIVIENADITFTKKDESGLVDDLRYIKATKESRITNSTLHNVGSISPGNTYTPDTSIAIQDSQIDFNPKLSSRSYANTALGNVETIVIDGSTISGLVVGNRFGCLGGYFETMEIKNQSEVYAQAESSSAIGPNAEAVKATTTLPTFSITISDGSVVEAASKNGAGIGMPYLETELSTLPDINITISGTSDVTAASIHSAAIGGGRMGGLGSTPDDGKIEIVIGAGIGGWGDGSQIAGDAGELSLRRASAFLATPRSILTEGDIAQAAQLTDNVTLTITDTPTITAKSGVLAVYADIDCTSTNLVQNTMVKQSSRGSNYVVYAAEAPGAVTIGGETLGELGYGYASAAKTGMSEQSSVEMQFGNSQLTDVTNSQTTFTVTGNGWQPFFTTPALELSGSVQLVDENGNPVTGSAAAGTTLKVDLSGLLPASARSADNVTCEWYRGEAKLATDSKYTLTPANEGGVVYCLVTGKNGYTGSVASNAVIVGAAAVSAPELESRTETSITLQNADADYKYSKDYGANWQASPVFENLIKGQTYTFIQKDSSGAISTPASFSTLSDKPAETDFAIDYVAETMSFPSGVNLYSDAACTNWLNQYSGKLSIDISGYISGSDASEQKLYARYAGVTETGADTVTEITIPCRPAMTPLNASDVIRTANSISFPGAEGVSYQLQDAKGSQVGQTQLGDGSTITFNGLAAGAAYTLKMRVEASNALPNPHFHSDQYDMKLTLPTTTTLTGTVLVPANKAGTYHYDLSRWLESTAITAVTETADTDNLVTSASYTGTVLTLNTASVTDGKTAALTVQAGAGKVLTLTVKAVNVMAEGEDGVLWVRPFYPSEDYIDGRPSDTEITTAWKNKAAELGFPTTGMESFALRPLNAVGGDLATNAQSAAITWKPSSSASISFDSGSFVVLHIPKSGIGDIKELEYQRGADSLTFQAEGQGGLYAVLYKPVQPVDITGTLKLNGQETNTFLFGQEMAVEVSVTDQSTGSTTVPTGKVSIYLGDPQNGGRLLGSDTLTASDNGKGVISYTVTEADVQHGQAQTLYIVYDGDYNYRSNQITKYVTFNASVPGKPVITATAGNGSVTVSWTKPAENGAAITEYQLSVTQNGTPVAGSPITIEPTATAYTLSGLTNGRTYEFILTAINVAGSTASDPVQATPKSQGSSSGSSGSSSYRDREYDFWMEVKEKIQNADPGDTIKANARNYDRMPWSVMEALRQSDGVTLHITWNGGEDIIIPSAAALNKDNGRIYYPLSYLEGLDFTLPAMPEDTGKLNPETGGVLEITAPAADSTGIAATQPEITAPERGLAETPELADQGIEKAIPGIYEPEAVPDDTQFAGGTLPWIVAVVVLLADGAGAFWFWKRRSQE